MTYKKCVELVKYIKERGFEKQISVLELRKAIMIKIGTDDRTIRTYLSALQNLDFIKQLGNGIFEIKEKYEKVF